MVGAMAINEFDSFLKCLTYVYCWDCISSVIPPPPQKAKYLFYILARVIENNHEQMNNQIHMYIFVLLECWHLWKMWDIIIASKSLGVIYMSDSGG